MNNENLKPFESGQSGNPKGRPKGVRNLSTILRDMLNEKVDVVVNGEKTRKPFSEVLVRTLIKKANSGDVRAISEVFDRLEGKARQTIVATVTEVPDPDAMNAEQAAALKQSEENLRSQRRAQVLQSFKDIDKEKTKE